MTIAAVIFDLDGLLIDSEPLWQEAEILIFQRVGIKLTSELCQQTQGLRIDEVVEYWYQRYPWTNLTKLEVEQAIVEEVIALIQTKGSSLPGVEQAITLVRSKDVKIALASSSAVIIIQAALKKLGLTEIFTEVYSAESEVLGKPHPGVYLTTASKLNIPPQSCLALEDSLNGVLAAKAAQMKCIAIPAADQQNNPKMAISDRILPSLLALTDSVWHDLN
ncbi:MAG: hexitol phosphatase HxpB [Cyanobacteria bacterium J06623_7]